MGTGVSSDAWYSDLALARLGDVFEFVLLLRRLHRGIQRLALVAAFRSNGQFHEIPFEQAIESGHSNSAKLREDFAGRDGFDFPGPIGVEPVFRFSRPLGV